MAIELKTNYTILGSEKAPYGGMEIGNPPTDTINHTATTWERSSTYAHSETYSLHIINGNGWIIGIAKTINKIYKFGFWYRIISGTLNIQFLKGNGSGAIIDNQYTIIGSWQYGEIIAKEISSGPYIAYLVPSVGGEFYIDDVFLKEIITIHPNIKNNFSKISKTKILSLFDMYRNFQPSSLWDLRLLGINFFDSIWDYLIGWYWNAEGSGNIVYNMAPGNGLLGGGLLPNLNVINAGDYWSVSGYGYSPITELDNDPSISFAESSFYERLISSNSCIGFFIKRTDIIDSYYHNDGFLLSLLNKEFSGEPLLILLGNDSNNYYLGLQWNEQDTVEPTIQNDWYFIFSDNTDILKVAKSDGTLLLGIDKPKNIDTFMIHLCIGSAINIVESEKVFLNGGGGSFGDLLIFNNKRLTQEDWGHYIYDLCYSRYGMTTRSW